jgi:hypothetical protein
MRFRQLSLLYVWLIDVLYVNNNDNLGAVSHPYSEQGVL